MNNSGFKLVFIIVSWNRREVLLRCLESIRTHITCPHKIVVVDNASTDGTPEALQAGYPEIDLIRNADNLGYGRANNQGLEHCRSHRIQAGYIVFLNNDVVLTDGSLVRMTAYLDRNPDVQAAVPSVFLGGGALQTGVGGYELSLRSAFAYFFFLSVMFPGFFKGFFISQSYFRKRNLVSELDWASGVCLAVRQDVFRRISGFPEDFFMYAEDIALCREIRAQGRIIYFPGARVDHFQRGFEEQARPTLWLESIFRYYRMITGVGRNSWRLFTLHLIILGGLGARFVGKSLFPGISGKNRIQNLRELESFVKFMIKSLIRKARGGGDRWGRLN